MGEEEEGIAIVGGREQKDKNGVEWSRVHALDVEEWR
jgi:hypothetical protein